MWFEVHVFSMFSYEKAHRIEMLSGARALHGDHIYTLASVNANAAVIKGVLKQGKPEQLTVTWREWYELIKS